jgi:hypothetical protein
MPSYLKKKYLWLSGVRTEICELHSYSQNRISTFPSSQVKQLHWSLNLLCSVLFFLLRVQKVYCYGQKHSFPPVTYNTHNVFKCSCIQRSHTLIISFSNTNFNIITPFRLYLLSERFYSLHTSLKK